MFGFILEKIYRFFAKDKSTIISLVEMMYFDWGKALNWKKKNADFIALYG